MVYNNFKIAFRNIRKNPLYSIINIMGLAIGFAFIFLILSWVKDEVKIDRFHENNSRIIQVMEKSMEGGSMRVHNATQGPLAKALENDFPEVEIGLSILDMSKENMKVSFTRDNNIFTASGIFSSKEFFSVFSFPLLYGNRETVLSEKSNIAISESMAVKLFGSGESAMGQTVTYSIFGNEFLANVAGVSADIGANSTLSFDFVLTDKILLEDMWKQGALWTNEGPLTYLLLKKNTNLEAFEGKIENYLEKHLPNTDYTLFQRKYSDAYLYNKYEDGRLAGGRVMVVKLFLLIALLILILACINFMNLSTARASTRLKEIGIKKVVGSNKSSLITQFLSESVLFSSLAFGAALLIMWAAIPTFNGITGKALSLQLSLSDFSICIGVVLMVGLLAGSYPAFYMSSFNPVASLKGKFTSKNSELFIRRGLVVFQFVVSLVLIISALFIRKQINYAIDKPMGMDKENVAFFDIEGKAHNEKAAFLQGLEKIPGVQNVGALSGSLISDDGGSSTYGIDWPGSNNANIDFIIRDVDENLLPTLGIEMAEGRNFTAQDPGKNYLLFNEAAIKIMNLENPIGTEVVLWDQKSEIIGVMKDFHTSSILSKIPPVVFQIRPDNLSQAVLKIDQGSISTTLENITSFYQTFNPGYDINFQFMDETIEAQYLSEQSILKMSTYFSYMAIFISCLGLLGLASFNSFLRMKEIGIRKVLGANTTSILAMLSKDFIKLVLLSLLIAIPISILAVRMWLDQFAYKIDVTWEEFAIAGIAALAVVLITVVLQSLKASLSNPIENIQRD